MSSLREVHSLLLVLLELPAYRALLQLDICWQALWSANPRLDFINLANRSLWRMRDSWLHSIHWNPIFLRDWTSTAHWLNFSTNHWEQPLSSFDRLLNPSILFWICVCWFALWKKEAPTLKVHTDKLPESRSRFPFCNRFWESFQAHSRKEFPIWFYWLDLLKIFWPIRNLLSWRIHCRTSARFQASNLDT